MLEVTQADRELFITLSNADGQMAERIQCGEAFTWEVEQLARHRLAEREAVIAYLLSEADEPDYMVRIDHLIAKFKAGEHLK